MVVVGGLDDYIVSPSPFPLDFGLWIWNLVLGLDNCLRLGGPDVTDIMRNDIVWINSFTLRFIPVFNYMFES